MKYGYKTKEEWVELFKKEYKRLKPTSGKAYNDNKNKMSPSWQIIGMIFGIKKWLELLSFCDLERHSIKKEYKRK